MLFSFSSSGWFPIEIENMFFVFLSSYRNTNESLGKREMRVGTRATCFLFTYRTKILNNGARNVCCDEGISLIFLAVIKCSLSCFFL